jgi:hypothetical protein
LSVFVFSYDTYSPDWSAGNIFSRSLLL